MLSEIRDINKRKIFAFFGSDLEGYSDRFLEDLYTQKYEILALDPKAIEYVSLHKIPYTIINDWLDTKTMLEIQDIAWDCEINWFKDACKDFTSNGICWPEFDHSAMQFFWYDAIASIKLANAFRERGIEQLLIVRQNNQTPYIFLEGTGLCKKFWETEFAEKIKIIDSKALTDNIKLKNISQNILQHSFLRMNEFVHSIKKSPSFIDKSIIILNKSHKVVQYFLLLFKLSTSSLYSSPVTMTGKIAFIASENELSRSKDALQDLLATFPKNIVIIRNQISLPVVYQLIKKRSIPVIDIFPEHKNSSQLSKKFTVAYLDLIDKSHGKSWDKIVNVLQSHFLYYCQYRWPMLDNLFKNYLQTFLKNPPKIIIGAGLNLADRHLPILAAKRCGIKTVSIPHSVGFLAPIIGYSETTRELQFDYDLYLNEISKEISMRICSIDKNKLIACKNCTDINSHSTRDISPVFSKDSWKILILTNPTSNINPRTINQFIYPQYKNSKILIESIRTLNSPPQDLKEKLSIKFKVHPVFSDLEIFNAVGEDILKNLLPTDSRLEPILDETDLVIGVNYFGSAFIHVLINKKPMICFFNDEFFNESYKKGGFTFEIFENAIKIVYTYEELWDLIRSFFTNPSVSTQMKADVCSFSDQLLDNSNYPNIGIVIEELLKKG